MSPRENKGDDMKHVLIYCILAALLLCGCGCRYV